MIKLRSAIGGLPVYTAGKPAPGLVEAPSFKLSSNENPFPPLPGVIEATMAAVGRMNRYPDITNAEMTNALSDRLGVPGEQFAFGTGSVAVLYHLLQATCEAGDEVIFAWRSFEAYPIAVPVTGATQVLVPLGRGAVHDLDAMRRAVTPATKAIMLCTPNNPTGPALQHQPVIDFIDSLPDHIMIVLDEAYLEFVTDPGCLRGLEAMAGRPNVVVLRTFSKAYGLAGFRVGYCVADARVAAAVRAVSLPFGVSIAAQAAVIASLAAEPLLFERVAELVKARDALAVGLRDLGFDVPDAQGNFVWLPGGALTRAYAAAFVGAGVAVRPFASGGDWDGVRITVGEPAANTRVLEVAATLAGAATDELR
ncbi:MAG TPA: histidinol-phosphate transaminase [Propionibacteriaceae bacterium]|nr:histidinol-phosphate transaminase [Propionibacteriaceae bacterium]